jgi:hypothetical protein
VTTKKRQPHEYILTAACSLQGVKDSWGPAGRASVQSATPLGPDQANGCLFASAHTWPITRLFVYGDWFLSGAFDNSSKQPIASDKQGPNKATLVYRLVRQGTLPAHAFLESEGTLWGRPAYVFADHWQKDGKCQRLVSIFHSLLIGLSDDRRSALGTAPYGFGSMLCRSFPYFFCLF